MYEVSYNSVPHAAFHLSCVVAEITPSDWEPSSPPIKFPSAHFLAKDHYKEGEAEYYDEQPPDEDYKPYERENEESGYAGSPVEHGCIYQHSSFSFSIISLPLKRIT